MTELEILTGDCRAVLPRLEAGSVQCCVTSPPYWGLRDYGTAQWEGGEAGCDHKSPSRFDYALNAGLGRSGVQDQASNVGSGSIQQYRDLCPKCGARRIDSQLGLEATPQEYIANMVAVFREVKRVLRDDGTLWVNLGDCYASNGACGGGSVFDKPTDGRPEYGGKNNGRPIGREADKSAKIKIGGTAKNGLKPKDLCMMPARVALALQSDGWYLRSDIIWHKPNPMPESVTDRPTKAHEYIFLLTKAERYFYDADAIKEAIDLSQVGRVRNDRVGGKSWSDRNQHSEGGRYEKVFERGFTGSGTNGRTLAILGEYSDGEGQEGTGGTPLHKMPEMARFDDSNRRNKRSVWTIATQPYAEAHFATFPEEIPKLCILAGSKPGDTVLDPFAGSGTTGQVAIELGRKAILIELKPDYIELAAERTFVTPGFL